jgi:hypothetical protein
MLQNHYLNINKLCLPFLKKEHFICFRGIICCHVISIISESDEDRNHPAGNHAYPFSLELTDTLPSSFEGTSGHVRYLCKATIERPWVFDIHVKRAFTVIHHLDLNCFPSAQVSFHRSNCFIKITKIEILYPSSKFGKLCYFS